MASWLRRFFPPLVIDAVILRLLVAGPAGYLKWLLFALMTVLSALLFWRLHTHRWVFRIARDRATRIAHGLEHATIRLVRENWLPAKRGFTHGRDRFVVVLPAGNGDQRAAVEKAANDAIGRIGAGEHSLAYSPNCGTSQLVSALGLWLAFVTSLMLSAAVGGSSLLCFALGLTAFRIWLDCDVSVSLVVQRLVTVSTAFAVARVVEVQEVPKVRGYACPDDETWYEVVVNIELAPAEGGLVAPGVP